MFRRYPKKTRKAQLSQLELEEIENLFQTERRMSRITINPYVQVFPMKRIRKTRLDRLVSNERLGGVASKLVNRLLPWCRHSLPPPPRTPSYIFLG